MSSELFAHQQDKVHEDSSKRDPPTVADVRAELAKILNSDPFVRSQRIKKLLEFLVESVLAGNQDHLKETLVGIAAFDRSPDYDSKQDPVVRVEMRRLRSKLSEYYLQEGKTDDVLIWLDKGRYVPALSWRAIDISVPSLPTPEVATPNPVIVLAGSAGPESPVLLNPRERRFPYVLWIAGASVLLLAAGVLGLFFGTRFRSTQPLRLFPHFSF